MENVAVDGDKIVNGEEGQNISEKEGQNVRLVQEYGIDI